MDKKQLFAMIFAASFSPHVVASLDIDDARLEIEQELEADKAVDMKLQEFDNSSEEDRIELYRESVTISHDQSDNVSTTDYHQNVIEVKVTRFERLDVADARNEYRDVITGKASINVMTTDPSRRC